MATGASQDGSEDVSDFLRRIKELGDAPDEADDDLEQEILESRRLREARRAERARSLSPDKQVKPSPAIPSSAQVASPSEAPFSRSQPVLSPTQGLNDAPLPEVHAASKGSVEKPREAPSVPSTTARPTDASSSRRPGSVFEPLRRPASLLGPRAPPTTKTGDSSTSLDRADITQSLSQKDPTWFRQTADRGSHSAALRKSHEGDEDQSSGSRPERRQLHGLMRSSSDDPFGPGTSDPVPSSESGTAAEARSRGKTPLTSPTHFSGSRDATDNLVSPTKGMGGFVQSAMLRRTESVNKRWSAQASAGLHRKNSSVTSGNKPQEPGAASLHGEEGSDMNPSRRSRSPTKALRSESDKAASDMPPTPSHQKRWSPNKSSWLESALSKPPTESPRVARPNSSQPGWLSDLNKKHQARLSKDDMSSAVPPSPSKQSADLQHKSDNAGGFPPKASKPAQPPSAKPKPARLSDSTSAVKQELHSAKAEEASDPTSSSGQIVSPSPAASSGPSASANPSASSEHNAISGPTESPIVETTPTPNPGSGREVVAQPKALAQSRQVPAVSKVQDRPKSYQDDQGELEFRSAFGKLKRAQTQNYKAPDELKDNIMRGKAGLATTGGPQKSERRDEFKESLQRQRASMSEKAADIKATPARPTSIDRKSPTPEAIAKKRAMGKSEVAAQSKSRPQSTVEASSTSAHVSKPAPRTLPGQTEPPAELHPRASNDVPPKTSGAVGSKLANRFNPALAGMIARGPPSSKPAGVSSGAAKSSDRANVAATESASATPQLDHVTKARARGPKRRPPKASETVAETRPVAALTAQEQDQPPTGLESVRSSASIADQTEGVKKASKPITPSKPSTLGSSSQPVVISSVEGIPDTQKSRTYEAKPPAPLKSVSTHPGGTSSLVQAAKSRAGTPQKSSGNIGRDLIEQSGKAQDAAIAGASETASQALQTPRKYERVAAARLETDKQAKPSDEYFTPTRGTPTKGPTRTEDARVGVDGTAERPTATPTGSNARDAKKSTHENPQADPQTSQTSPKALTNDAGKTFADFFNTAPQAPHVLTVNVSDILSAAWSDESGEFRTLEHEISALSSDGKRIVIPASQQAVLCNDRLYLIKHVLKSSTAGQRVEVYMWVGSTIAQAAVEDAQLFARKYARESGGSLEVFRQGKEPAKLFQALGDTVITKRSSSTTGERSMLCGRKHLKQYMTFDEVDFSLNSFSSGFPFIIAGTGARIYLWKGRGCSMDELANAQMTSMNLSPSGEVIEVADGEESAEFLDLFPMPTGKKPVKSVPRSADHWKLKSQHSNYCTRLFQVTYDPSKEAGKSESSAPPSSPGAALWNLVGRGSGQQDTSAKTAQHVKEISPYDQTDLEREQIYVLDAFFEMYVIVGPDSQDKADAFATALLFAQDYSILAAGSQDRPFVPVGTVVLQGAPRDLKACFRGWNESAGLFGTSGQSQVTTGRSLRIVPLSAALVAVKAA